MLKESENPPIAWPEEKGISDFTGEWWVAHTKSRHEKALAQDLIGKNINYFLPMTWRIRRIRGRKIRSLLPLFGGYLFFCGSEKQRLEVLRTNRVSSLIEVKDQQSLVKELSQIQQALQTGTTLQSHPYIKKGQICRVTTGPLKDLRGIVVQTKAVTRLVLQIDMLGQAASVEVDTDMIDVIE